MLFFDTSLSSPAGQSCATCHDPKAAFTDPRIGSPTSQGAVHGLFGNRQAPSIKYLAYFPNYHWDANKNTYLGGFFWDGRAKDLKDQVHQPMLNPAEMNNSSKEEIVAKVRGGVAGPMIRTLYGQNIFSDADKAMDAISDAIVAFEKSPAVSPFTSKFDAFMRGEEQLTPSEQRGLVLFNGKGLCVTCHTGSTLPDGTPPLFTNFAYSNIGSPKNPANPYYTMPTRINPQGSAYVDPGLKATTKNAADLGKVRVPTLRNIAQTAPYFHNGFAKTLEEAVQFYNKRDLGVFGPPEVASTMVTGSVGNLKLTDSEVSDLVAFLKTLSDR